MAISRRPPTATAAPVHRIRQPVHTPTVSWQQEFRRTNGSRAGRRFSISIRCRTFPATRSSTSRLQCPTQYPRREDILRIDYNITERTRLSARYTNNAEKRLLAYGSFASDLNFPLAPVSFPRPGRNGVLTLTHTFSPTLTNEFIFGPSSNFIELRPDGDKALASSNNINVPKLFPAIGAGYVPNFRFGGIANQTFPFTNYNGLPFINQNHTFNFIDNISKIIGSHSIKAGFYAQRSRKDQTAFARTDGDINFDNNPNHPINSGHPFSNALLGVYNNYTQANNFPKGLYRYWNVEGYIQDNWKATRRLTLDYGLRVSWYEPQYDRLLQTGAFNPIGVQYIDGLPGFTSLSASTQRSVRQWHQSPRSGSGPARSRLSRRQRPTHCRQTSSARSCWGRGDLANGIGQANKGYPRGGYNDRGAQWGPRFGFAYDVSGNGRLLFVGAQACLMTAFRATSPSIKSPIRRPFLQPQLLFGRLQDLTPGQSGLLAPSNVVGYAREGFLPTIYSMSLGVQRDIGFNTVIDVSYVGTLSRHLFLARELNATPFGFLFTRAAQDPSSVPWRRRAGFGPKHSAGIQGRGA